MRGDCRELEGGGVEGLGFGKFFFFFVYRMLAIFFVGVFEGAGSVNLEFSFVLLFSVVSFLDIVFKEEAEL